MGGVAVVWCKNPRKRAHLLGFEGSGVVNKHPPSKPSMFTLGFEGGGVVVGWWSWKVTNHLRKQARALVFEGGEVVIGK